MLACAAPPPNVAESRPEDQQGASEPPSGVEPEPPPRREVDPLLARARAAVRGGRISDAVRRELAASPSPDHRHAARLLQAIAGETVAEVLARSGAPSSAPVEVASADELFEPEPGIEPSEPEPSEPDPAAVEPVEPVEPSRADELVERPPKLSSLPPESPARWWFASASGELERPLDQGEVEPSDPNPSLETLLGPLPVLLRERPPLADAPLRSIDDGPRLVILTSLTLRSTTDEATLELAGAGSVRVAAQPLQNGRVRLWMLDAGAVPGFTNARPAAPGIEVVDVARRDRRLEIEVELGHGWTLVRAATLENGASVQFARLPADASSERVGGPG